MQIFYELNKGENFAIALGFFDGVHIGHKAVIESAVNYARENNLKSAVITFREHPCCYLWNVSPKYILLRKVREEKIKELGVDYLYELDFSKLCKMSADEYLQNVLVEYFRPKSISSGQNHNFGCDKSGNSEFLKENSHKYGYKYFETADVKYDGDTVSSTRIRKCLTEGNIKSANAMLGYRFSISGEVIRGRQIGRTIGYKTANIKYPNELITLPYGVYSTEAKVGNEIYKAIANFGVRPTVNGTDEILEVHILGFDEDIYGENIEVFFYKMIRKEQKFSSLDELKKQIKKDIKFAERGT